MGARPTDPFDDPQLELFDADTYWDDQLLKPFELIPPATPLEPEPLTAEQQLGWDKIQRGAIAQAEFELKMIRLGANPNRPVMDPGGNVASDTTVVFKDRKVTVQVKSAKLDTCGRAEFDLGPRDGPQTSKHDGRRVLPYIGRADFFALAVFNEDTVITDWYLIPAARLRLRVTLAVSPGRSSQRRRKGWLEPERFREAWHRLLDVPALLQESPSVFDSPIGEL